MATNQTHIEHVAFVVDERPFCVWEWDLRERNLEFIKGIDCEYFEYTERVHAAAIDDEKDRHRAALSLRTAYSHGCETLLALLFASVQAPDCVVGWLHKYQPDDIAQISLKISKYQPLLTKTMTPVCSWPQIADVIFSCTDRADETLEHAKTQFSRAWSRFASDFSKDSFRNEYNSVKHGLRSTLGGFSIAIGPEKEFGVPAAPESMRSIGGSEYGSSFFVAERIGESKIDFRVRRHARNWQPTAFLHSLIAISYSIQNVVAYLRLINGDTTDSLTYVVPKDFVFENAFSPVRGPSEHSLDTIVPSECIRPSKKEDILASYVSRKTNDH